MFTNYGHFLARQERYKDMLREADQDRQIRIARLLRTAEHTFFARLRAGGRLK
jgi:hypothetical protein